MVRTQISAVVLALTSVFTAQAMARTDPPQTREEVKADLADAIRNGDMLVGDSSETLREIYPNNYPARPVVSLTRAEVEAELAEAIRTGNMLAGEGSETLREINPQNYPAQ